MTLFPDFLSSKILAGDNIIINTIGGSQNGIPVQYLIISGSTKFNRGLSDSLMCTATYIVPHGRPIW